MLVDDFFSTLSQNAQIASFNKRSAIIHDGNIRILCGFAKNDKNVEYSKEVTLFPSPQLPEKLRLTGLVVLEKLRFALLWSSSSVFAIRLKSELFSERWDRLQPDYYCECYPLFSTMKSSVGIEQIRILPISIENLNLVAVLCTDSVIRFYNINSSNGVVLLSLDFGALFSSSTKSKNTFGLRKEIVSFDFCVQPHQSYISMLTVDSEGEMYGATVHFSSLTLGTPVDIYPIETPRSIPTDPIDIRHIEHSFSEVFQVFALLSAGNIVSHLIAMPNELGIIEVHLHEKFQLPSKSPIEEPKIIISSACQSASYEISTENALYSVNISGWTRAFVGASSEGTSTTESVVREVLVVVGDVENGNQGKSQQRSVQGVSLVIDRDQEEEEDDFEKTFSGQETCDVLHLVCILGNSGASIGMAISSIDWTSSCLESNKSEDPPEVEGDESQKSKTKYSGLCRFPQPFGSRRRRGNPAVFLNAVDEWVKNQKEAVSLTLKRCVELQTGASSLEELNEQLETRIFEQSNNVEEAKLELFKLKDRMEMIRRRLNNITARIDENMPLSALEIRMLERMKEHQNNISMLSIKIPQLALEVSDQRRKSNVVQTHLGNRSKKLSNVEKNSQDIENLRGRIETLKNSLNLKN
ncbi:unnamed protein product [Caenorhabditis auriculariae]|uniref:Uncharacterized protein n=1 Tax=Caenorhabditis auriculariae TaxID=2777116 RepID=A0A8S1HNV3_9PELO|nr:unnamed protein product [Caenorhabditis auriculariae]